MAARRAAPAATRKTEDDVLKAAMERVQRDQGGVESEPDEETPPAQSKRAANNKSAARQSDTGETVARSKGKATTVTYAPIDKDDPVFVIWFGMKFDANLPREVTNKELIALARQNPWWLVDGKRGAKRAKMAAREDDGQSARSGLPDGLDPEKAEVEAAAEDFE